MVSKIEIDDVIDVDQESGPFEHTLNATMWDGHEQFFSCF